MLIIMCGFPGAGKSVFVELMEEVDPDISITCPKDWLPENFDSLSQKEQRDFHIGSWETALDSITNELAKCDPSMPILLDTCGASPGSMNGIWAAADLNNHDVYVIWVATPQQICGKQADGGPDIVKKYDGRIAKALNYYKDAGFKVLVVKHGSIDEWKERADKIVRTVHGAKDRQKT